MSHDAKHLGDALTWIERNHPGGIALVARALAETYPPSSSTAPRADGHLPICGCGKADCPFPATAAPAPRQPSEPRACWACGAPPADPDPAPARQPSDTDTARDPLCKCLWSPVSPAGRIMCDHCRDAGRPSSPSSTTPTEKP
jgi:hypothetical protein